jgi:hypothetical protein
MIKQNTKIIPGMDSKARYTELGKRIGNTKYMMNKNKRIHSGIAIPFINSETFFIMDAIYSKKKTKLFIEYIWNWKKGDIY